LGKEELYLSRDGAFRLGHYLLACRLPIRIGSKNLSQ
jgi:hypothetical protein